MYVRLLWCCVYFCNMSRIVRKPDFCLGENKGADQLRGNREADQRLCFRYTDSTISLLLKSEISSFQLFSELVQAGLCQTWSETPKTGFLASRLIYLRSLNFMCSKFLRLFWIYCFSFNNVRLSAFYYFDTFCHFPTFKSKLPEQQALQQAL